MVQVTVPLRVLVFQASPAYGSSVQVHRRLLGDPALDSLPVPDVYFGAGYGAADREMQPAGDWQLIEAFDGAWQLPVVTRSFGGLLDGSSPYGYAGAYADPALGTVDRTRAWDAARSLLRETGVASLFLRQSPLVPQSAPPGDAVWVVRSHPTMAVPLCTDEVLMLARMEGRSRTSIRKAQRLGLKTEVRSAVPADLEPAAPFRLLYEEAMRRREAAPRYFFGDTYYERLLAGLGEDLWIASVSDGSRTVAAALFLRHNELLHYHLSGSSREAGRLGATNQLIWEAARVGCAGGVRLLHLGGGVRPDDSLERFKRQFGGDELVYSAYGLTIDADVFERAVAERVRETGQPAAKLASLGFPAYRQGDVR